MPGVQTSSIPVSRLVEAGADVLVAGNAIFAAESPEAYIEQMNTL